MQFEHCIPKAWKEYEIKYKYKTNVYNIKVKNKKMLIQRVLQAHGCAVWAFSFALVYSHKNENPFFIEFIPCINYRNMVK